MLDTQSLVDVPLEVNISVMGVSAPSPVIDDEHPLPWNVWSWCGKRSEQQPEYVDKTELTNIVQSLKSLPPIVSPSSIDILTGQLADVLLGKAFILQGGDCAESFDGCKPDIIESQVNLLSKMSSLLSEKMNMNIISIGRIAGQYAKPRSKLIEKVQSDNSKEILAYRGDGINGYNLNDRTPNPKRLLDMYFHSAATHNHLQNCGANLFTSHEGLLLPYESSLVREQNRLFYDLSAHFLWIGDRTRNPQDGHVEFFRGIQNPIGVKIGPSMTANELRILLRLLNPSDRPGRIVLITRYGASNIESLFPEHLQAVRSMSKNTLWMCDPMHGNTETLYSGYKTRQFQKIVHELELCCKLHAAQGSRLHGIHLELTGTDHVIECLGGTGNACEENINYMSLCDPRLNYQQSIQLANSMANIYSTYFPT